MERVQSRVELHGIEILRFISSIAVLIWHYQHFFFYSAYSTPVAVGMRSSLPFYHILTPFYESGCWAVQLFWTISGFILFMRYSEGISHRRVTFQSFANRRFSRLYPLHIATVFLVIVLQSIYLLGHEAPFIYQQNDWQNLSTQLFMASNWFDWQPYSFNGPIWSVSAEILIYLIFYGVIRAFGSSLKVACAGCLAFLLLNRLDHWHLFQLPLLSPSVIACGLYFFAGGIAGKVRHHRFSLPVSLCLGVPALLAFGLGIVTDLSMLVLATSATIICAQLKFFRSGRTVRVFASLGNATYSSYLLHFPIQLLMVIAVDALGLSRSIFLHPLAFLSYVVVVFLSALAVYRWFEVPAQNWIRSLSLPVSFRQPSCPELRETPAGQTPQTQATAQGSTIISKRIVSGRASP